MGINLGLLGVDLWVRVSFSGRLIVDGIRVLIVVNLCALCAFGLGLFVVFLFSGWIVMIWMLWL